MTAVTLLDGRQVDSASEEWRHETEARWVAARPSLAERRMYLEAVEKRRGLPAAGDAPAHDRRDHEPITWLCRWGSLKIAP